MKLNLQLSQLFFTIKTVDEVTTWLHEVDKEVGGIKWLPVGGIDNNVHTVEVSSDPALALVERPTNAIDALLELKAREQGDTSPSPHDAAKKWWGVPEEGLSAMSDADRRNLADHIRVTMNESGVPERPTVVIQDQGTGQHPDDFIDTLLSLLASNKKSKTHVMGVYNAGGSATYKFARYTLIASRLAPQLLEGRHDEIGVTVVRYNPLDPDKFKSGVYEYMAARDGSIIRLNLPELPEMPYGTQIKLVEYSLSKYAGPASAPSKSLWHLFHAALPDPALPFRIIESRAPRYSEQRRVIVGLLHQLRGKETADYSDDREIDLGDDGTVRLRYFVLNEDRDPDAYTTTQQALTISVNGQRQITRDRQWLKRNLSLFHIFKRVIVVVDGTGLSNAAKRQVFSSTRETGVDSPLAKRLLDRVVEEMKLDEQLYALDEQARQRTLADATKTTTERVKRQLASQIAAVMSGAFAGGKGGGANSPKPDNPRPRPPKPIPVDDSMMPEIPDVLTILTDPVKIRPGGRASLTLAINAKNDFLPKHSNGLTVVFGPETAQHVLVRSKGRLLGGRVRVTLEAVTEAAPCTSMIRVALVVPELGVLLTAEGALIVAEPKQEQDQPGAAGGQPNIEVSWIGRHKWSDQEPPWDDETVGECNLYRENPQDTSVITKAEFLLNEAFTPYETVVSEKNLNEVTLKNFRENYELPVLLGLFQQRLAEEAKENEADDEGQPILIPDDYVKGEKARMARATLMAMEPSIMMAEAAAVDS